MVLLAVPNKSCKKHQTSHFLAHSLPEVDWRDGDLNNGETRMNTSNQSFRSTRNSDLSHSLSHMYVTTLLTGTITADWPIRLPNKKYGITLKYLQLQS